MKKNVLPALLLIALALMPQVKAQQLSTSTAKVAFPVRLGILADSQITTSQGSHDYGMRRKAADRVARVAIRPAAVELLAPLMLERFLIKLEEQKVDVLLYLGDGANSGCKDELDTVFSLLDKSRQRSGIPSYYLIGNHDYLGTGNQTKMDIRQKLCNSSGTANPAETKKQVIERISMHNLQSAKIDKNFAYSENTAVYPQLKTCAGDDTGQFNIHHVGLLSNRGKQQPEVEILLVDTSDYRDVDFRPEILSPDTSCEIFGGWGTKGSMSYKNLPEGSQIGTLAKLASPTAAYRLVASHYRPFDMNAVFPFNASISFVRDALGDLLSKGENIWVSGHTHAPSPIVDRFNVGKTLSNNKGSFDGINVGSTTDYNPHVIIVEAHGATGTRIGTSSLGYTKMGYAQDAVCSKVLHLARKEVALEGICGKRDYAVALGLDQSYRKPCWDDKAAATAGKNIEAFSANASATLNIKPDEVKACLAYVATTNEHPKKKGKAAAAPGSAIARP
ncbi:MAG: metallophosphoesterase [Polaromonas sp.]|uniref:metallophosphoesterase n=1 Tax=Polaromonas sp. TaxID=1869339 RepID=UPI00272F32AB|nr:metallophosphoesterase [Polaromonas sp.]MDP1885536.1 metallophosphoesterase [Polaromonas sp.]MDP2450199.1 metallophosphoesterase [Polaromonas sp.]MDP3249924.1 metallophosphoesterase [Polaromonas sp.]MDP3754232.1 metallophosphoesterase [Polaromonas sp.]